MANNPREFPKKISPLVKWYLGQYPDEANVRPSGAVRLGPVTIDPPTPSPDPDGPDPQPVENLLFNKEQMMEVFTEAVDKGNLPFYYNAAFAGAIDRWNKLASYPDSLIAALANSDAPYKNGIIFDPREIPWGSNTLAGGPQPSMVFVTNHSLASVSASATPFERFGNSVPAPRPGQVVATGALVVNLASPPFADGWGTTELQAIFTHELGHWLGINSYWGDEFVDEIEQAITSGYFYTLGGFNLYQPTPVDKIPLQASGGQGTVGAHWEKKTRLGIQCIANEMMTAHVFLDGSVPKITRLSMGCLADYGYKILGHEPGAILSTNRTVFDSSLECLHEPLEGITTDIEL